MLQEKKRTAELGQRTGRKLFWYYSLLFFAGIVPPKFAGVNPESFPEAYHFEFLTLLVIWYLSLVNM